MSNDLSDSPDEPSGALALPNPNPPASFGTLLGVAPGNVPAYSSDYNTADESLYPNRQAFRNYAGNLYLGFKWQCVEFARRWLYVNFGYVFDDVAMAYEIFRLRDVRVIATHERLPLQSFANGSKRPPEYGSLLIWSEGGEFARTGHVAVVTEVFPDRVRIAEQNTDHKPWPDGRNFSREIPAITTKEGHFWVSCSFHDATILGWVTQTSDATHAVPHSEVLPALQQLVLRTLASDATRQNPWLNEANPVERAYVEANATATSSGHVLSGRAQDAGRYVCMSQSAEHLLIRATNELHAMFLHATDYVLRDDQRLAKFNIPSALWSRIHQSWDNRRNEMITGRLDFAVTPEGIKVYEYNCDSASCHMECGYVQGQWARAAGCDEGRDAGEQLRARLVQAWRESAAENLVHILLDDDPEERYHALFMQDVVESAGLRTRLVPRLDTLRWTEAGELVDAEGEVVRWVWKTWAWETALDQIRDEIVADERAQLPSGLGQGRHGSPRLVDVLLRPDVMVFEPLWTLIPSNKAILPVLWELYPDHPWLLESGYAVTDTMREEGYVEKPIVGRCGANITIVATQEAGAHAGEATGGKFAEQDTIYQALFSLPQLADLYTQVCTFTAGGRYAGACVRTDPSRIIRYDSDLMALRTVADSTLLQ